MEPLFFKAENLLNGGSIDGWTLASMEPLFFKAENPAFSGILLDVSPCFNGAAFFQSGKRAARLGLHPRIRASMEPLFFKAENNPHARREQPAGARFNGAAFFQSGKRSCRQLITSARWRLQWSRFFSKRKTVGVETNYLMGGGPASMEPLFFKAENLAGLKCPNITHSTLQWSRFFSKRKTISTHRAATSKSWLQWSRFFSKRKTFCGR